MPAIRILLAEDEKSLSSAICAILKHSNYSVDAVYNGTDALDYGLTENYDCIILDIMMPGISGIDVLTELRQNRVSVPVLMLTAKGTVDDKIAGLDAGADDYLAKPFAMGELLARLRAVTRRKPSFSANIMEAGNVKLDRSKFVLSGPKSSYRLGSKEFQVMEMLMGAGGGLVSAEQFIERIWGYDTDAEANVVRIYISFLRKKLGAIGANIEITVNRGAGYQLGQIE